MIEKIILIISNFIFWQCSGYLESWYWLQHDGLVSARNYHIPRAIMTLFTLYLLTRIIGFPLALFSTTISMIGYEFRTCAMLHGSWKFWKSWTYKLPGINLHYPTFAGWLMMAIINIGGFAVYIEGGLNIAWWVFYGITTIVYWVISFTQKMIEIKSHD